MTNTRDRFSHSTYMAAVLAGDERVDMDAVDDWVGRWHDGGFAGDLRLHEVLGFTWLEYGKIMSRGSMSELIRVVASRLISEYHETREERKMNMPSDQSEFQRGLQDGTRYRVDGHEELIQRYQSGGPSYRLGWAASASHPRAQDPDHAT